jgi:hypothetical protein
MYGNMSFLFTVHYVRITTLPCGQFDDFTTLIEMIPGPAIYCLRIHERSMARNIMGSSLVQSWVDSIFGRIRLLVVKPWFATAVV